MNRRSNLPLVLPLADPSATLETVGGKGASLARMVAAGLPVPPGFHVTTAAYRLFVQANGLQQSIVEAAGSAKYDDPVSVERASAIIRSLFEGTEIPEEVASVVRRAYAELGGRETAVAVRSSATAEDLPEASFAGQQETYLNVRGERSLLDAVRRCWASLWTARAMAYRARRGIASESVSLAVVVQRMAQAEAAGVLFTANPANGRRDQAVIDAAWGLGEAIVGGTVTPDHLVVDKESGKVLSRETADKAMMTVRTEEGTVERPVPAGLRQRPVLDDGMAEELARLGAEIEAQFGRPQDIEWAVAGGRIAILQSRPITALPEPIGDVPADWSVPDPTRLYYRASIVEQLPNPLSPLFATMAPEPIAQTLNDVFVEVGFDMEGAMGFTPINGYGYVDLRLSTRQLAQMMVKLPVMVPIFRNATRRLREEYRPRYERAVERWRARPPRDLPAADLLAGAREMLYRGVQFYTGAQAVIPVAVTSEVLFTEFYNRLVRRAGDPPAQTFLLGFDSVPIQAEKSLYDLAAWCREHPNLAEVLTGTPSDRASGLLATGAPPEGVDGELWREWQRRFQVHLDRYGHMLYDLDFVNSVPADEPAPLFETMKFYLRGEGVDPHARQRQAADRREEATEAVRSRLDGGRWRVFHRLLRWAQEVAPERENALADVGLGWPPLRRMLLELGRRLAEAGAISKADDVFWLEMAEVERAAAALDGGSTRIDSFAAAIEARKMVWRGQKRATPPQSLPKGARFAGLDMERFMPAVSHEQEGDTLKGVAAGAGRVTAPARVLHGPEDFGQMRPGEVLVAGITTPAWTPLFALASAVVTDIGGPLSHSSIVAREYGIPAVLGTGVASKRIRSGETLRVDGDAGTVTLLDRAAIAGEPSSPAAVSRRRDLARVILIAGGALAALAWWRRRRREKRSRSLGAQ